jgi:hypothetical protein
MLILKMNSAGFDWFKKVMRKFKNTCNFLISENFLYGIIDKYSFFAVELSEFGITGHIKDLFFCYDKNIEKLLSPLGLRGRYVEFHSIDGNEDEFMVKDKYASVKIPYSESFEMPNINDFVIKNEVGSIFVNEGFVRQYGKFMKKVVNNEPYLKLFVNIEESGDHVLLGFEHEGGKISFDDICSEIMEEKGIDLAFHSNTAGLVDYKKIDMYFGLLKDEYQKKHNLKYAFMTTQHITDKTKVYTMEMIIEERYNFNKGKTAYMPATPISSMTE